MQFKAETILHAVKESAGTFEGKAFSSTTFHMEVDLKENGAGRSIGRVTRPFKFGDAAEFEKWVPHADKFPLKCEALFEMEASREDKTSLKLVGLRPLAPANGHAVPPAKA